jgi:hypothetical protein
VQARSELSVMLNCGFMKCDARQQLELRECLAHGQDEIRLREACIDGKLASYLELVMGKLEVPSDLHHNPYPLEDCHLAAMVTQSVVMCTKFLSDSTKGIAQIPGSCGLREIIGKIMRFLQFQAPDHEAFMNWTHDRVAFIGTGFGKRYRSGMNNERIMPLSLT